MRQKHPNPEKSQTASGNEFWDKVCSDCEALGIKFNMLLPCYLIFNPNLLPVFLYRVSALFASRGSFFWLLSKIVWRLNILLTSCHIDPNAVIGGGLLLPHATGIVIGPEIIGRNVCIHQGVTIGRNRRPSDRYLNKNCDLEIGDNVDIYSGAVICGADVKIGTGATIGANAVVITSVLEGYTAVGVPARMFQTKNTGADPNNYPAM